MRAVHGDDIFGAGLREEVPKLVALLKKRWGTQEHLIGLRDQQELHIPNRKQRWRRDSLVFAADVRRAKEVIEELGLVGKLSCARLVRLEVCHLVSSQLVSNLGDCKQ